MFSIIIPLYNKEKVILSTINSVLEQTYHNFELIIVDDGSTDKSSEKVKSLKDPRIKYYYKENGGVSSARNYGIGKAQYDWIFFLDADDYVIENALEHFAHYIERYPDYKLYIGDCAGQQSVFSNKVCIYTNALKAYNKRKFIIRTGNTVFHKNVFRTNKFNEQYSIYEDLELFILLLKEYSVVKIPHKVFVYETDFCFLSRKRDLKKDFISYAKCNTENKDYNRAVEAFIGMRLYSAITSNDQPLIDFIKNKFPNYKKYIKEFKRQNSYSQFRNIAFKAYCLYAILVNFIKGNISPESNRKTLLSSIKFRYAYFDKSSTIEKNCFIENCNKAFIYKQVRIGKGLKVYGTGRFIIRANSVIGKNLTVYTKSDNNANRDVIIGRNVIIGNNVTIHPGVNIEDNSVINNNAILR